tara:strand:+ start:690 stop:887 length:198 start_codon:yes stop_codon:yes gene_type:complete
MTEETKPQQAIPNEVQIDVNDNTTAYNRNVSVRITDGGGVINPEELSKIAFQRIKEVRKEIGINE